MIRRRLARWRAPDEVSEPARLTIIGPGTRFLSGVTYHTYALSNGLARRRPVSVLLLRRLLPQRWYPGASRVGADISHLRLDREIDRYDGVDWWWFPSILVAIFRMVRRPPAVLLVQWWSGAVLHTELALASIARLLGAKIVIEVHEALDTGEDRRPLVRRYVQLVAPYLFRRADLLVCHSEFDVGLVGQRFGIPADRMAVIPLAAWDHYRFESPGAPVAPRRDEIHFLFFGVIRPFKGLEDLVRAFDAIPAADIGRYRLTVVGETWEGWTEPLELIARSRHADRISVVNRYVRDEEVDDHFRDADVVVLPYHRSSASGPLHVAMGYGLPVVVTAVGGLVEATDGYDGAVLCPPRDPEALRAAMERAAELAGRRFAPPRSSDPTWDRYEALLGELAGSDRARHLVAVADPHPIEPEPLDVADGA